MPTMKRLNCRLLIIRTSVMIITWTLSVAAQLDSTRTVFIDSLEKVLRSDYRLCTADSSDISTRELLQWRQSIDSIITSPQYPVITQKFLLETGLSPSSVRPCEIVEWFRATRKQQQQYATVLDEEKQLRIKEHDDSLFLAGELAAYPKALYDMLEIPFGISRRAFMLIVSKLSLPQPVDQGSFIRFDSIPYGTSPFKMAFHFSGKDHYRCYEIESNSCSFDSLNVWARPAMNYLAAHFEAITSVPPNHIYRIGQFDIVPGRLAICKMWVFPDATAYIGLARNAHRFYAKATIVWNKDNQ